MAKASLAIQVVPIESVDPLNAINAAISVIQDSGIVHEIGAMETTLEHDSAVHLMEVALAAHEAALKSSKCSSIQYPTSTTSHRLDVYQEQTAPFRSHDT